MHVYHPNNRGVLEFLMYVECVVYILLLILRSNEILRLSTHDKFEIYFGVM